MTNAEAPADPVLFEIIEDHIAVVTLNRPEARNAINVATAQAIDHAVRRIEADDNIRVVVLASSDGRVFSAGADLKDVAAGRARELLVGEHGFAGLVDAPRKKPWIAAVRGAALGGGCELVLACDMVVASEDAVFGLPEVKRGLFAGAGGVHRIARALPRNIALELVATGDPINAADARAFGLVNRLVASDQVREAAIALARAIAVNAPLSVTGSLDLARRASETTDSELRLLSREASNRIFATEDAQEGPRAFIEKRTPVWKGR